MQEASRPGDEPLPEGDPREWRRPAALFLLLLAFSAVRPSVLVGLPFALMVLALPIRRPMALLLAGAMVFFSLLGPERTGIWYAERGWAVLLGGWFAALTLRWPATRFLTRALMAVAGAAGVALAFGFAAPGSLSVLDWGMAERLREGVTTALAAVRVLQGGAETLSPALVTTVYQAAETQAHLFPALLALGSVASLGVAWWLYVRVGLGVRGALAPLKDFRFNDQLVWLFIAGLLVLVISPGEGWMRAGANAVVFMGAMYALRGAAVVLFINGGISVLGVIAVALGLLFVAPIILAGALVIGLGDTWLDLRARAGSRTA